MHRLQGVVKPELTVLKLDSDGHLRVEVTWLDSAEVEEQLMELGPSPDAGCWILQGYASGYASFCLGKPVYFQQLTCRGRGDEACTAIGMDQESWGGQAEAVARPYKVDGIQGKVEELTTALRKKTLELARQRKRLRELKSLALPGLAEVRSKSFQQVLNMAQRVAKFDSPVLITGESGVGKEVVARYIHDSSDRRKMPFVAINCGAIPENLLESELFGHKAGSFTGATRDRAGLFEEAEGGTLLLDEIGDIKPALQVKLLRVLQEKRIRRVGENRSRPINVHVIAATHQQLSDEIKAGTFREDLFYRLRVVEIRVPPLRERPEDIIPLAHFFIERLLKRFKLRRLSLDPSSLTRLEEYPWPGNVRELENALERATVMCEDGWVRSEHLPSDLRDVRCGPLPGVGGKRTLAEVERAHILAVLEAGGGNRTRAASILGISATTLWRKLKSWGLGS
jgi:DNA-binding NtrC family response regulator